MRTLLNGKIDRNQRIDRNRFAVLEMGLEHGAQRGLARSFVETRKARGLLHIDFFRTAAVAYQHPQHDPAFFAHALGNGRVVRLRRLDVFNA